ncbi:hypothetical protein Tco_1287756 [Tanacetum coccineum]
MVFIQQPYGPLRYEVQYEVAGGGWPIRGRHVAWWLAANDEVRGVINAQVAANHWLYKVVVLSGDDTWTK